MINRTGDLNLGSSVCRNFKRRELDKDTSGTKIEKRVHKARTCCISVFTDQKEETSGSHVMNRDKDEECKMALDSAM